MELRKIIKTCALIIGIVHNLHADLLDPLSWVKIEPSKSLYFAVGSEDKTQLLTKLKEEKEALEASQKQFDETVKDQLEKVTVQTTSIKKRLEEGSDDFLQKKLSILNENHQSLIDLQLSQKEILSNIDQQIKALEEYLRDPEFKTLLLDVQAFYSFEHLQNIMQKMAVQDDVILHLEEQKNILIAELENRKKTADQLSKLVRDKEREQKDLGTRTDILVPEEEAHFDFKQRADLMDQNLKLLTNKRRLIDQKITEAKRKISLLDTKIFIEKEKRKVLDEQRLSVKEGLKVEESDIALQRVELDKKKQAYLETKESFYHIRKNLLAEEERQRQQLEGIAKDLMITIGNLRDWDELVYEPKQLKDYVPLAALINTKENILRIEKKIELLDAQINAEESKFDRDSIATEIIDSWHKITMRKFRSEENVESEIKKYSDPLLVSERELAAFTEKRNVATNFLAIQNKILENLQTRMKNLDAIRHQFYGKNLMNIYNRSRDMFMSAQLLVFEQIEINRKIIEVYSNIINIRSNIIKQINTIISELRSIGPRSTSAISWEGIKNIPSDIEVFATELINLTISYCKGFTPIKIAAKLQTIKFNTVSKFLTQILLILILYFLLQALLPLVARKLIQVQPDIGGMFYIARFSAAVIDFSYRYYTSVFIWLLCYCAINLDVIADIFPQVLFYLISIPFLIIMGKKFIAYFVRFNTKQDYLFFSDGAYQRLKTMINVLMYTTIIIFLFREAFMLAIYSKSDLPTILITIYSIIVRLMLISLIRKEDILEFIPTEGVYWQWIRDTIEEHYYAIFGFLIALIIMSEPHIGYGKYVSYVLWGTVGTIVLVRVLMLSNMLVRRVSTVLFFTSETEIRRERFPHARTAYGIFVIAMFVLFATVAFLIIARIWGYIIALADISDVLNKRLMVIGEGTIDAHEINLISFLQIAGLVVASLFVASMINAFVLRRIFDLLMVEQGVQYTISTIMQYVIVIAVIMIGFTRIGLGYVVISLIVPLLLGLGWATKEFANDFFSYFIILVQRPFKIGDLIKLENDTQGVVRKITPRSVILRSKNSVTVVIPNSKVVNDQIVNWNYSRTFFAFNDIALTIPYAADPAEVKVIIARVLDANMHVLKNPRPIIWLHDFGEHGFIFLIRGFLSSDNVSIKDEIASDVRFAVIKSLREHSIPVTGPTILKMTKDTFG